MWAAGTTSLTATIQAGAGGSSLASTAPPRHCRSYHSIPVALPGSPPPHLFIAVFLLFLLLYWLLFLRK